MDSAKLNDWMQVVGIFAVVLSLIFVGMQMKQSQNIAIAAQYQERYATIAEILSDRQLDPDHAQFIGEREISLHGLPPGIDQSMSAREYGRRFMGIRLSLQTLDNYHFQYESGFLTEDAWASYLRQYDRTFRTPVALHYFDNYKDMFRPSFLAAIEHLAGGTGE